MEDGPQRNILSYREITAHGLSFELLVDGQPISALVGAWDTAIPYYLILGDLPTLPGYYPYYAPEIRVLAVAACCGEIGCGHARCRVIADGDTIIFRDFAGEGRPDLQRQVFRVARSNYAKVLGAIVYKARQYDWLARHAGRQGS